MLKREAGCPLCGARMTAQEWLLASISLLEPTLGVLAAHCPYCQGYLELRPVTGGVEIGYLAGQETPRFDVAMWLPYEELVVMRGEESLVLQAGSETWEFKA